MAVFMPQAKPKDSGLGTAMGIGQLVGGIYTGNPAMAASGGAQLVGQSDPEAGQALGAGATAYGMLGNGALGNQAAQESGVMTDSPMSRRLQQQQQDPVMVLANAKEALAYQPPEVQKEYGSTIDQALKLAQKQRGLT